MFDRFKAEAKNRIKNWKNVKETVHEKKAEERLKKEKEQKKKQKAKAMIDTRR